MRYYLSIGGNIGDRLQTLRDVVKTIGAIEEMEIIKVSSVYDTPPWGVTEQETFYNIALEVETDLEPLRLLHRLQQVEEDFGRERTRRWGPRTVDIDIICTEDDQKIRCEELVLPHPYATERAFVIVPLAEIAPRLKIQGQSVAHWFLAVGERDQLTRLEDKITL